MVKVTKSCEICEKVFTREVGSNAKRAKYCSSKCHDTLKRVSKYGITFKELNNMIKVQGGCCYICNRSFDTMDAHNVNIDHCHKTGKVRKILCLNCNQGLGQFKDSVDLLKSAIVYLEEYN